MPRLPILHPLVSRICPLLMIIVVLTGCQAVRSAELQTTNFLFSADQEASLGKQYAEQIEGEIEILDDPVVQQWVQRIGDELVRYSPPTPQQFTFQVTTSPEVNAFAIPGGFCYINAGLIRAAENEAQVVAVIGHEINHVTTRHGMRSLQRAMGLQAVADLASADPQSAAIAQTVANAGGVVAMRGFSRSDEREADRLGVEAMYRAGWDPREAARFFEILLDLQRKAGAGDSGFLTQIMSSHPATQERIDNIREQIQGYDLSRPLIKSTPQFADIQARMPAKP